MESTKQIRSIRSIRGQKKTNLLPSFQGGVGGRLFPLTKRAQRAADLHETHGVGWR